MEGKTLQFVKHLDQEVDDFIQLTYEDLITFVPKI
jgi:hypothetical protein